MKTQTLLLIAALTTSAYPQGGPLTPPPGAPEPTLKSLDLIEPRIPLVAGAPGVSISGETITINQSGSYYLTGNIDISTFVDGIRIDASGVTLDLMGHSIRYTGTGLARDAIEILGNNVTIQDGHIISTTTYDGSSFTTGGFVRGIIGSGSRHNITVRNLSLQGIGGNGIGLAGTSCSIENCTVRISGLIGIGATYGIVRNCVVQTTGTTGIVADSVHHCQVSGAEGSGIEASIISNSSGVSTGSQGIIAVRSVTACYGETTSSVSGKHGISCESGIVSQSQGVSSGGHGIFASIVSHSHGISQGGHHTESCGIRASRSASDSSGHADNISGGDGIHTELASHCTGSRISSAAGRYGLRATQANGCHVTQNALITHKYNMP